ncbi:MAG: hypothetical protein KC619_01415 [Myxococcales bacterium]|nr:hypothetical protein [Myxococcales bacterium]
MSRPPRIGERTSLEELAALVCTTLEAHGISVVLSGGAVVSIYSDAEYVSYDLDFIPIGLARKVDTAMESLGFEKKQRHWTHPKSRYWVEFPPGPVAIGEETIRTFAERETRMGTLRLLGPTECVMDRLAWFFHDADTQCLEQAVAVATRQPVDMRRIERWARGERPHGAERFREFERRLREGRAR